MSLEDTLKIMGSPIPNYDEKTGIFYGVIAQNSLNDGSVDDILMGSNTTDISYEEAIKTLLEEIDITTESEDLREMFNIACEVFHIWDKKLKPFSNWSSDKEDFKQIKEILRLYKQEDGIEEIKEILEEEFNQTYENDTPEFLYEANGYKIIRCLDYDLMILKSPYYCYAPECSPCVPCAGNLDSIDANKKYTKKTYCLDSSFFEESGEENTFGSLPGYKIFEVGGADKDKEVI